MNCKNSGYKVAAQPFTIRCQGHPAAPGPGSRTMIRLGAWQYWPRVYSLSTMRIGLPSAEGGSR